MWKNLKNCQSLIKVTATFFSSLLYKEQITYKTNYYYLALSVVMTDALIC